VAIGRGGQETAGPGWLRASDADRERVVGVLKAAFVEGRLTRDELEERVVGALTARTHADLATVTAGIPAGVAAAAPGTLAPAGPISRSAASCTCRSTPWRLTWHTSTANSASADAASWLAENSTDDDSGPVPVIRLAAPSSARDIGRDSQRSLL
jgi:uncharacterized protein DUF1707